MVKANHAPSNCPQNIIRVLHSWWTGPEHGASPYTQEIPPSAPFLLLFVCFFFVFQFWSTHVYGWPVQWGKYPGHIDDILLRSVFDAGFCWQVETVTAHTLWMSLHCLVNYTWACMRDNDFQIPSCRILNLGILTVHWTKQNFRVLMICVTAKRLNHGGDNSFFRWIPKSP